MNEVEWIGWDSAPPGAKVVDSRGRVIDKVRAYSEVESGVLVRILGSVDIGESVVLQRDGPESESVVEFYGLVLGGKVTQ